MARGGVRGGGTGGQVSDAPKPTPDAATAALDAIATLCGSPAWEYPGQVVRDMQAVVERDLGWATAVQAYLDAEMTLESARRVQTAAGLANPFLIAPWREAHARCGDALRALAGLLARLA